MEDLIIEERKEIFFTPQVEMIASKKLCEISGESYVEDAISFYQPIIGWIKEYGNTNNKELTFNFKLTYFNTSSSKSILDVLNALKEIQTKEIRVQINWYYPEDNYDLLAEAEDFIEDLEIDMNLIPYQLDY